MGRVLVEFPIKTRIPPILMTSVVNGQRYAIAGSHWIEVPPETTREDLDKYFTWEPYRPPESASSGSDGSWTVTGSKGAQYTVRRRQEAWTCSCPGFGFRRRCKHVTNMKAQLEGAE